MSWADLVAIIKAECPPDLAATVERRILADLGGVRLTVPQRPAVTATEIQAAMHACGWKAEKAAKALGMNKGTLYRRLRRVRASVAGSA